MKILVINPLLPYPPDRGGNIVSFNLIRAISQKHEVYLLTCAGTKKELEYKSCLEKHCSFVDIIIFERGGIAQALYKIYCTLLSVLTGIPRRTLYFPNREMKNRIRELLNSNKFDLVQIEYSFAGEYSKCFSDVPKVLIQHNVEYMIYSRLVPITDNLFKRLKYMFLKYQIKRYELGICRLFKYIFTLTQEDAKILRDMLPDISINVLPPLINIASEIAAEKFIVSDSILFVGGFSHQPNTDAVLFFCRDILPKIKREVPNVKFFIAGKDAPEQIKKLGTIKGITVYGYVNNISELYEKGSIFVIPLRAGSGIKVKLLDSMAKGLAIVSTSIGVEGVPVENKRELLIADEPGLFARHVIWLLKNEKERKNMGTRAFKFIKNNMNFKKSSEHVERMYDNLISGV